MKPTSLLLLSIFTMAGCASPAPPPTVTPLPTTTDTPIPVPTETATPTATVTATVPPTETPIPEPAWLTGAIYLSGNSAQPFVTSVELRGRDGFALFGETETDSNGVYRIENIDPDTYELWVLITTQVAMISGCSDVAPPDAKWQVGVTFADNKALLIQNANLSKALLLLESLQSPTLKAQGVYFVLERLKIESGVENQFDVALQCK
jgi:hypothetical protein